MQFCFVSTRRGSHFMTELLVAIADAVVEAGHSAELVLDEFPQRGEECVYVVVPHEFDAWGDRRGFPDARQRARTIALCTENRGTEWFEATYRLVPQYGAAVSINRASAAELRRRGVRCEHIQLGYVPSWDSWQREVNKRDIDVLYLGAADPRRDPLLAGLGAELAGRQCELLVPPLEPRTGPRPDFLTGTRKYDRLRSAQILLNLHRTTSAALEWMRFLEAICNGCVVVSEPCIDGDPLLAGEHFVEASADRIGQVIDGLLDEPDRLGAMREQAYDFVRSALPMRTSARCLAELAAELPGHRPEKAAPQIETEPFTDVESAVAPRSSELGPPASAGLAAEKTWAPTPSTGHGGAFGGAPAIRGRRGMRGRIPRSVLRTRDKIDVRSQNYAQARPQISVLTVVTPDNEQRAMDALASVSGSTDRQLEVLAIATAATRPRLEALVRDHPELPFASFRAPAVDALGIALNRLIEHARGDHVFLLEPTGGVFPDTISRLTTALDNDPDAYFAYSMVAVFDGERPARLRSSLPWEPDRLKREDWIDGMALVRRDRLLELGCFTTDARLAGWEAFDLWCKCAEAGGYGLHIPQVLAWHRRSAQTLSAEHDDPDTAGWTLMQSCHPRLLTTS